MRRGTRVGQAYIALTADGSGINDDITDSLDDVDYKDLADKHGRQYSDNFRRHLEGVTKTLEGDFKQVFGRIDALGRENSRILSSRLEKAFDTDSALDTAAARLTGQLKDSGRLDSLMDEVGRRAGHQWGNGFDHQVRAQILDSIERNMQEAIRRGTFKVSDFIEDRGDGVFTSGRFIDQAVRDVEQMMARINKERTDAEREWVAAQDRFAEEGRRNVERAAQAALRDRISAEQEWLDAQERFAEEGRRMAARNLSERLKLEQDFLRAQERFAEEGRRQIERRQREEDRVSRNRGRDSDLGARVGRLFGAGSRNNFLNLFGRSIGGLTGLFDKVGRSAANMFSTFNKGFSEGTGLLNKFGKGFAALGESGGGFFASIAKAGPGALIAIAAVGAALTVLTHIIASLIALVTALVSTIVSGLVGAFTVLGGSILAVVAAGGLLTAAFMSMTDAQKDLLKNAFTPLREQMIGIGQIMLQQMIPAFQIWSENLQRALTLAAPVAQVMGAAFAEAGKSLTAAFSGPGFMNFANALGVFLPGIVTRLSNALGSFLNGLLGLFSAVMPFVNQFAGYLERVANRFSDWANSAQGQNAIVDFTDRALTSLKSLWNFTREFFGFLGDLLFSPQAQNAGNSMFDSLARSFEGFRKNLSKAAKNGDLKKWFDEAIEFGGALKDVMQGLTDIFQGLYDSGTLTALTKALTALGKAMSFVSGEGEDMGPVLNGVSKALSVSLNPVGAAIGGIQSLGHTMRGETGNIADSARKIAESWGLLESTIGRTAVFERAAAVFGGVRNAISGIVDSVSSSISQASTQLAGQQALAGTSSGPAQFVNPYTAWAESIIKDGPTIAAQIRTALSNLNKQIAAALASAGKSKDGSATSQALLTMTNNFRDQGRALVDAAQQAVNSAAQRLAGAGTAKEARKALRELSRAQSALQKALDAQKRLNSAAKIIASQRLINSANVTKLVSGLKAQNVTLAEFARARQILAGRISDAQDALEAAIQTRNSFNEQVTNSIKAYGSLVSAQAKTLNGIEQSLTAGDVTQNLRDRLAKIKEFQDNLRILLAQGLSDEAYKQLVEAGVEGGAATASALVAGGASAIGEVNSLLSQIGSEASGLGSAAADRMYQNGVNMAKGLLDGLKSLDSQLATQAAKLGDTIAGAIRRALGIKSPSRVLIADMEEVGNGAVIGLDNQHSKVGAAAARLASKVAVSPEVAAYAARQNSETAAASQPVSGNDPRFRDLVVVTPTEDPEAVAMEVLNEVTGRL